VLPRVAKAFIFYRNHLTDEDQVLLLMRSATDPHRPGSLDIPGGAIDDAETLEQAVVREIREETGVDVNPSSLKEITDSGAMSNESNVEKHVFMVRIEHPEFTVSVEHESGAWYPLMEAARLFPHPFYGKVLGYIIDHQLHQNI
jgi:8-oxo-dGTP pyrophosphatase MutT (NUDIX family)